ncbi:MAG: hypothetical protein ACRDY6_06310 [Acidimicrobiia bacterium]
MTTVTPTISEPDAPREPAAATPPPPSRLVRVLFVVCVIAALLPVAVAVGRAWHREWIPVGDDAYIAIRTHDVGTSQNPLLGSLSSAATSERTVHNHPGPLLFEALALPARLLDGGAGIVLGVGLINALSVVGIAVFARRQGSVLLAALAIAITAALCWSMGSELLYEPWNPYVAILPVLLFLVLVWSVTCGDLVALPWMVAVGSLVVQINLSHVLVVPVLAVWALTVLVFDLRRRRRRDPAAWPLLRRRVQTTGGIAGVVLLAAWVQPLVEQFTADDGGNVTRLVRAAGEQAQTSGYALGARVVASVVALPPWWFRPSFEESFIETQSPTGWQPGSLLPSVLALLGVAVVLAACIRVARRNGHRPVVRALSVAVVALLAALLTAGRAPVDVLPNSAHSLRWLWPVAAFVFFAVVATVLRLSPARRIPNVALVGGLAVVTVALASMNLPTSDQGTSSPRDSISRARELVDQLGVLDDEGTVLVVGPTVFNDPYAPAIMADLQRRGIPFVIDPRYLSPRQVGSKREFTGSNADVAVSVLFGNETVDPPAGTRRIAEVSLSERDRRELTALERRMAAYLRQTGDVPLNEAGELALADGVLPVLAGQTPDAPIDPQPLLDSGELAFMVTAQLLDLPDTERDVFEQYPDLRLRWEKETVAVVVGPVDNQTTRAAGKSPGFLGSRSGLPE